MLLPPPSPHQARSQQKKGERKAVCRPVQRLLSHAYSYLKGPFSLSFFSHLAWIKLAESSPLCRPVLLRRTGLRGDLGGKGSCRVFTAIFQAKGSRRPVSVQLAHKVASFGRCTAFSPAAWMARVQTKRSGKWRWLLVSSGADKKQATGWICL